jgi:p-cumic aldehyde dehydrogenase
MTTDTLAPETISMVPPVRMPDTTMLIGAERIAAQDGRSIAVEDPATGQIFAHVPAGSARTSIWR